MVRAKMRCQSVVVNGENEQVSLHPVYDEQNKSWSKWTPAGSVSLTINNPDAQGKFKADEIYYVDFTVAPATEAAESK